MCVFLTLNHSFYSSTSSTPSVRADIYLRETYTSYGHKTTTQIAAIYIIPTHI